MGKKYAKMFFFSKRLPLMCVERLLFLFEATGSLSLSLERARAKAPNKKGFKKGAKKYAKNVFLYLKNISLSYGVQQRHNAPLADVRAPTTPTGRGGLARDGFESVVVFVLLAGPTTVNKNTNNDRPNVGASNTRKKKGEKGIRPVPRGMAWRSHGTDNDSLVDALVRNRVLKTRKVIDAMRRVDRGNYCVSFSGQSAYEDHPLPIGSNATISAPHMHAACLELVHDRVTENARVLDVGSGSVGISTSCFAYVGSPRHVRRGFYSRRRGGR